MILRLASVAILLLGIAIASGQQLQLSPASNINSLDPCKFFENVTGNYNLINEMPNLNPRSNSDVQQLNHHEFVAFEQCVYYFLANKAQRSSAKFGAVHPIATLPPTYAEGAPSTVKVRVGQITLQHFQLNEFLKDLNVVGYMQMEWTDSRLAWDSNQWKLDKLQIHSGNILPIHVVMLNAFPFQPITFGSQY